MTGGIFPIGQFLTGTGKILQDFQSLGLIFRGKIQDRSRKELVQNEKQGRSKAMKLLIDDAHIDLIKEILSFDKMSRIN